MLEHSAVLNTDGTIAAWGDNRIGAAGDGTVVERLAPVTVSDSVLECDPASGKVTGWIDLAGLLTEADRAGNQIGRAHV